MWCCRGTSCFLPSRRAQSRCLEVAIITAPLVTVPTEDGGECRICNESSEESEELANSHWLSKRLLDV
jgi:hypothetical protein